jgi:hypothetical protein
LGKYKEKEAPPPIKGVCQAKAFIGGREAEAKEGKEAIITEGEAMGGKERKVKGKDRKPEKRQGKGRSLLPVGAFPLLLKSGSRLVRPIGPLLYCKRRRKPGSHDQRRSRFREAKKGKP